MSHVKPLAMATALALSFTGMNAFAATPSTNFATSPQPEQATYYVVNPGTPQAQKVYYFNKLDRNHDGALSRSELPTDMHLLRAYFVYEDWNNDGKLSPDEYLMYKNHTGPRIVGVEHSLLFVYN